VREIVVLPRFGSNDEMVPTGITHEPPSPGRIAWSARALALAARRRFDVIFCGHLSAAPLAAALARLQTKPLWIQVHGIEVVKPCGGAIGRAVERAALVTAVSRYTRGRLLTWANIDPARVRVLPNTVSAAFTRRSRRADLVARHRLAGAKVILTVGRLAAAERYKGHDRIIRVLPRVAALRPETVYLVVGSGDDQSRLEALARDTGMSDRIRFAGEVAANDLPDYYSLGDVFTMPSVGEGFGIVFLEAARSGLPIVGGNRDGSVDALAEGRIGRAVDPDDEIALADAIVAAFDRRLGTDPDEVARFTFPRFASHVDELVRRIA
jgi:phosphatidylinositol alpha-1,6-mannosyltransferase